MPTQSNPAKRDHADDRTRSDAGNGTRTNLGGASAEADAGQFRIHVDDEVSPLKTVIVHQPGREMERLTPPNHDQLLFDDLLSPARAKEEHEFFVDSMRSQGVETLEFMDLFRETLADPKAKEYVLENTVNYKRLGPLLAPNLAHWAYDLDPAGVARLCVEGITKAEWEEIAPTPSLVARTLRDDDFLIGPLPNHMFTRDASAWMYGGVAVNSMSREVRRRESLHYSSIYKFHPRFRDAGFQIWTTGFSGASRSAEGGDILVLGNGLVAVGVSERTTPQGVERLAERLFRAGRATQVLAIMLPPRREFMHLDTVMTQIDVDRFVIYPEAITSPCVLLRWEGEGVLGGASHDVSGAAAGVAADSATAVSPSSPGARAASPSSPGARGAYSKTRPDDLAGRIIVEPLGDDVPAAMERAMGRPLQFIWPDATAAELSREQWNDGFNMLALAPGKVVAYSRTPRSNRAMRDAGVEVIEIDGSELGRGRGGPRCMSCPIERG